VLLVEFRISRAQHFRQMVDEGLREDPLLFGRTLRKRSLCVQSSKCRMLAMKLDNNSGHPLDRLVQGRRRKLLYVSSSLLFRQIDRVKDHERVSISSEETTAIRERRLPKDKRFAALSKLAKTLIEKRGHLSEQELDSFIAAGFTKEQAFEVIAIVAASTITNYAGTIANPPLEDPFRQYAWQS
jgi:alkylhydroperoxidase family enzyme